MVSFKPSLPYTTPLIVFKPTYTKVAGVPSKEIPDIKDGFQIFASFKSYGGTESTINGIYSIVDTVDIETWFRPDITSDCIIVEPISGAQFQLMNTPENINNRNQFMRFKIERIKGGA